MPDHRRCFVDENVRHGACLLIGNGQWAQFVFSGVLNVARFCYRRPESCKSRRRHAIACHSAGTPHKETNSGINQEIFTVFVDDPVRRPATA